MVVKLKWQGDLDKERREYEKNHKRKVEKAEHEGKEGVHLPHLTARQRQCQSDCVNRS